MTGCAAEKRRHDEGVEYMGLSAHALQEILFDTRPEFKEAFPNGIHNDTIRHLFSAPHSGSTSCQRYHNIVEARPRSMTNILKVESVKVCLSNSNLLTQKGSLLCSPSQHSPRTF